MLNLRYCILVCLLSLVTLFSVYAQTRKQIHYLSGKDNEHTVVWDFWVTGGRQSGQWSKIAVPSHWEQQGFGSYNYGRDYVTYGKNFRFHDEKGIYRHHFQVPQQWQGNKVTIVFEGSMTDTEVKINGRLAGEIHQGSFYQFEYDISEIIKYGQQNQLEVTVSKMSADQSVNNAERLADYWVLGGIFRPVYLAVTPKEHISWTAIDAQADGSFASQVHLENIQGSREIQVAIKDNNNSVVGTHRVAVAKGDSMKFRTFTMRSLPYWMVNSSYI